MHSMIGNEYIFRDGTQLQPKTMRLGLILGLLMYGAFGYLDVLMMPSNYQIAWLIRFAIIAPMLVLSYAVSYYQPIFSYSKYLMFILLSFGQFGILVMIALSKEGDPAYLAYYAGLILVMLWASFVFLLRFAATLYLVVSTILFYNIIAIYKQGIPATPSEVSFAWFIGNNFFLISAGLLVLMGARQLDLHVARIQKINSELEAEKMALSATKKLAETSDRLKTTFLQNISHEIRTPLNGIMGFLHLLEDFENTEKEERNLYIGEVKKSTGRLVKVISDVLELSLIESGNIVLRNKPIDLFSFLSSIVEHYEIYAKSKGIQLESKCLSNGESLFFHSDPIKLKLILSHLIDNAIKFTSKGKVTIWCKEERDHFLMGIKDTGIGISEANRPYIFDRFWQAEAFQKTFFGGNGMGLPIVEGLSKAMNIQLHVTSVEAEGSEFVLTIPKNIKN